MGVVFEMNSDMTSINRVVYSFIDWLSDLGGLMKTMNAIFTVFFFMVKYNGLDFYMVSKLYSRSEVDGIINE